MTVIFLFSPSPAGKIRIFPIVGVFSNNFYFGAKNANFS